MVLLWFSLGVISILLLAKLQNGAIPFIVLMIVSFIMMSIFLQLATVLSLRKKRKILPLNPLSMNNYKWSSLRKSLLNSDLKEFKSVFGFIYVLVDGETAYRVSLVENTNLYFNKDIDEKIDTDFSGCKNFIGFEIFKNPTSEQKAKILNVNMSIDNIYYRGLYFENNTLTCPNHIFPEDVIKANVARLEDLMQFSFSKKEEEDN